MRHLLVSACLLCSLALPGCATSMALEQGGWSSGGPLRLSFAGTDADADGALSLHELTDFSAVWITPPGPVTVWQFTHIEPDGFFFVDVNDFVFFVRNAEYSLVSTSLGGETLASVFDRYLFPVAGSATPATVVPEPSNFILMGAGILFLLPARVRALCRRSPHG